MFLGVHVSRMHSSAQPFSVKVRECAYFTMAMSNDMGPLAARLKMGKTHQRELGSQSALHRHAKLEIEPGMRPVV